MRVDINALSLVASQHYNVGGEASTFDVKLEAIALRVADGCPAGATTSLRPASADLILSVRHKLTGEIKIVAVTCTAQLEVNFPLSVAAWTVSGVATNTLGGSIFRPQRSCT